MAWHETKDCTLGSGKTHNNAFGIMTWNTGKRSFKKYSSCEESYEDFKRLWKKGYKTFPDIRHAKTYSGDDRAAIWLANVKAKYSTL